MPRVVGMAGTMPSCVSRSNMAKRFSPFSQHSLEHSWNSASSFGPYSTRRASISWSEFSEGLPMMVRSGALALKGDTEAPGHLHSGKGMALGEPEPSTHWPALTSTYQTAPLPYWEAGTRLFLSVHGSKTKDSGHEELNGRYDWV